MIDDEAPLRRVTQLTLKITAGWEVWGAASGKEGVQQAELEQPDVILLDLMMPDVDGLSTLKMLQDNPKTQPIPIILLTAKLQTNPQLKLQYSAIKAVLVKPFDPTTLAQEIKKTLNWI
uniref:Two-component system response regulator n=1 Tax=Desertifilum tharense IPPAS B-1220 TaxID=1781255 RepID=A0A1E5QLY0_9CYAN|nr:two-component system response regulator [Desertifilum tharense IPPAS B-1220]